MKRISFYGALLGLLMASPALAQPLNVLFYGNSFTLGFGGTRSVNDLFTDIATAAGQETPLAQSGAASGQDLGWHLDNNTQIVFTLIPPDRDWDFVVMQEHSTKLTRAFSTYPTSVEESKADAVGLYNAVTQRSADVVPVLYETWARGPGHEFYTSGSPLFTDPAEMQAEVRSGYDMLQDAIDTEVGSDLALIAPVGDAFENGGFDTGLYANDLWHAQNRGTLLAALVIYGTIYGDDTSDIDLSGILPTLGLTPNDGVFLTGVADATLGIPEPTSLVLLCTSLLMAMSRRRH